jgi:HSP20 family protein
MLTRYNPFGELLNLHTQMDRLFDEVLQDSRTAGPVAALLPLDIKPTDKEVVIEASLPGFKPEDVEVTIEDGVLTIQARREDSAESNDGYLRRERHWGSRYRQVALPWEVKADQAKATFDRGVLTLTIPKAPSAQPIKVPVNGTEAKQISAAKK